MAAGRGYGTVLSVGIALFLALAIALAAPAAAPATQPTGNTKLVVAPGKARVLAMRGVRLGGGGAAETRGRQVRFRVAGGAIGERSAQLGHSGALRFTAGKGRKRRVVRLTGLRVHLGPRPTLSAKLEGGKRRVAFDLRARSGAVAIDILRGTARLLPTPLVWRDWAARTVGRRLDVQIPRGALGTLAVSAAAIVDTPRSGPISDESPLLPRPAGAVDVTAATLTWHVRDSWVRYVGSEVAEPIEGATPKPAYPGNEHPCPDNPVPTNPTLVYSYELPFSNGWYDPPTGTAAIYHSGGVRFAYPSRGIDLTLRNPEIEINGPSSRAIFRLKGAGATAYPDKRAAVMSLSVTAPPAESPPGAFAFPDELKATLTTDGEAVFGGFYTGTNNGFGCFSVAFSTGGGAA